MASIINCEAGAEPYQGKLAVGVVVMNRIKSRSFPNTLKKVIYQKYQFSPVRNGSLNKRLRQYDGRKDSFKTMERLHFCGKKDFRRSEDDCSERKGKKHEKLPFLQCSFIRCQDETWRTSFQINFRKIKEKILYNSFFVIKYFFLFPIWRKCGIIYNSMFCIL